jgi:hypothetical protein
VVERRYPSEEESYHLPKGARTAAEFDGSNLRRKA